MISGVVDDEGIPVVQLEIAGNTWRAVIDTGFNGDLELPLALKSALDARFVGSVRSLLAGGQTIDEEAYVVRIPFDGLIMAAQATFVDVPELLVGTHLLRSHLLDIDFIKRLVRLIRADDRLVAGQDS